MRFSTGLLLSVPLLTLFAASNTSASRSGTRKAKKNCQAILHHLPIWERAERN